MSWEAVKWASEQSPPHATDKLVLWALADMTNRTTGRALPSVAQIVKFTMLGRKSVLSSLARLECIGLVFDTSERVGKTKQIKVWRLVIRRTESRQMVEPMIETVLSGDRLDDQ